MQRLSRQATVLLCATLPVLLASCSMLPGGGRPGAPSPSGSIAKEDTLRTQIFLDAKGFGPGVVDGRSGEFTGKALARYQQANGLSPDWRPDISNITTLSSYTITEKDLSALGTMADEPEDQAKQPKMPYTTLIELLSERFHTTQKFLRTLNPGVDLNSIPPGTTVTVPAVARPFRFDAFPSTYPAPSSGTASSRRVLVDLREKMLEVREGSRLIAAFPITPGSTEHPAPAGEWRITGSVPWPWYRYDEGVLKRGERTENFFNLPPGPNNPVGILWAGLNRPGIGIHGTPVPDTIGRAGSHGCIRLSNWDAAKFHSLVGKGTPVTIR
ncbi:MAG: murein L,D-transpeptidase [Akkermansiaceae bacterium]|nr:murein L,D-transpeptidase [Akkermansiaceae bacterium]